MNIHRLKRLIKEEVKRLKEQNTTPWGTAAGNVGTPGQPIQIRAGWKNKMVNVYTSFGCGGLKNRKKGFMAQQAGLVPNQNPRWRAMLQAKIDFMTSLERRYQCY
tara:strand:- start:1972 stop:2286 length:315 start_codon:yes stop_codon:yes gene_type:complete